jgi:HAD superfamily phosphatase (TIGR01668 family)
MVKLLVNRFLRPHIYSPSINHINFEYLRSHLGIKVLIFDKDDTLTLHHIGEIYHGLNPSKIEEISSLFKNQAFICSNSRRKWTIDYGKNSELIAKNKTFQSILTKYKKPFNFTDLTSQISAELKFAPKPNEICIVGDRLLTDVLLARYNDCMSIFVDGFPESVRSSDLQRLRELEAKYLVCDFPQKSVLIPQFHSKVIENEKLFV